MRRFGFGASAAGGRPFGIFWAAHRQRAGDKSSGQLSCLSADVAGADKRLIMRALRVMNKQTPQSAISHLELRAPINRTILAQISA